MPQPNEAKTRKELIDPALKKADWNVTNPDQVGLEIPIDGFDPKAWEALKEQINRIREIGGIYNLELPAGVAVRPVTRRARPGFLPGNGKFFHCRRVPTCRR